MRLKEALDHVIYTCQPTTAAWLPLWKLNKRDSLLAASNDPLEG